MRDLSWNGGWEVVVVVLSIRGVLLMNIPCSLSLFRLATMFRHLLANLSTKLNRVMAYWASRCIPYCIRAVLVENPILSQCVAARYK